MYILDDRYFFSFAAPKWRTTPQRAAVAAARMHQPRRRRRRPHRPCATAAATAKPPRRWLSPRSPRSQRSPRSPARRRRPTMPVLQREWGGHGPSMAAVWAFVWLRTYRVVCHWNLYVLPRHALALTLPLLFGLLFADRDDDGYTLVCSRRTRRESALSATTTATAGRQSTVVAPQPPQSASPEPVTTSTPRQSSLSASPDPAATSTPQQSLLQQQGAVSPDQVGALVRSGSSFIPTPVPSRPRPSRGDCERDTGT